ncbi:MAG: amidohydrolase [Candidatus Tectomicrobia bacterium]|uniref:Amidohydrolase n=1 Tax=Tectimicrobiota bacterium TaxID=2528274 RepID=A0A933GKB2_UNCTE|nr:amidohydrolase [Candidatus Tectomicrobia bacterium]
MTIDMHAHLLVEGFYNKSFVGPMTISSVQGPGSAEEDRSLEATWDIYDPDGLDHIRRMDQAGIEKCNLLHLDMGILFGEGPMPVDQQNKHLSQLVKKHPDRFTWFCGVDPRRPKAAELARKCITEWGASGIKFYPTTGFLPADRMVYPLYEVASSLKVPVYFHMGPEAAPYRNEGNAHPSVLLRVLVDFPQLKVLVAHLAFEYWRDLIALGKVRENVMTDFCAWQVVARKNFSQFCHVLRKFLDEFGVERVMFGTDAPLVEGALSSKDWVEMIKGLAQTAPTGYRFTEEEISALLIGNASRLLASIPQSQKL